MTRSENEVPDAADMAAWKSNLLLLGKESVEMLEDMFSRFTHVLAKLSTERQAREAAEKEVERLSKQSAQFQEWYGQANRERNTAEAKLAALEATLFTISKKPLSDGSEGTLDIGGVLIDYDDGIIRARAALSALPPPVPTEEAETVLREDAQGRLREAAVPTEEGAEDKTCFMCHGKGRHEPIVAWPAVSEIEDKLRRDDLPDSVLCSQCSGTGKLPTRAPQDVAPIKRTMTLNLTDEEMDALEKMAAKQALKPQTVFRQALRVYQLYSLPEGHPERIARSPTYGADRLAIPTQAPQDVAGLVEVLRRLHLAVLALSQIEGKVTLFEASPSKSQRAYEAWTELNAAQKLAASALRPSPISHESKALELAAADDNPQPAMPTEGR